MSSAQTPIRVIGIMSPGDMGHAVARELRQQGFDLIACLEGRSARTADLAARAGIRSAASLQQLVVESDVLLSILVPANAAAAADEVARAVLETRTSLHYVDCNAISPERIRLVGASIESAGGQFTDASIIGFPPGTAATPRLYVSGPAADGLRALDGNAVVVKHIGSEIGRASAIKMCYAALTKGTFAIEFALLIAAKRLDVFDELLAEFESSQCDALERMHKSLPRLPAKSGRWVGEMEEIAATFDQASIAPGFFEAAASIYEAISHSSLGDETPESIDLERTLAATIAALT